MMKKSFTTLLLAALATTVAYAAKTASTVTSNCGYITWTLDKEYPVGQFVNGDWYVVGPAKVIKIENTLSDKSFLDIEFDHSGSMINPIVNGGQEQRQGEAPRSYNARVGAHGYDERIENYRPELNAAIPGDRPLSADNPLELTPDQSLISLVSWLWRSPTDKEPGCPGVPTTAGGITRPTIRAGAVFTCLKEAPPEGTFRPSYAGDKKRLFNVSQLKRDRLLNLAPVAHVYAGTGNPDDVRRSDRYPSWSKDKNTPLPTTVPGADDERSLYWSYLYGADLALLTRGTARAWIDHIPSWGGSSHLHPAINMSNYGRESNHLLQSAMLALHLDWNKIEGAPKSKDALLINMCQIGIDTAGAADAGSFWLASMGHHAGRKPIILFAGLLLDDEHMKNVGHWKTGFQDDDQLLYITEAQVEHTNSDHWKPDTRGLHLAPYNKDMIGMPEWIGNQAGWNVAYRDINNSYITGFALTFLMMEDGVKLWNNQVQFDYADRANGAVWEATKTLQQNHAPAFVRAMWDAYRKDYPSTYDKKWDDQKIIDWITTPSFMLRSAAKLYGYFELKNDEPIRMTVGTDVDLSKLTPTTVAVTGPEGEPLKVVATEISENPGKFFVIKFAEGTQIKPHVDYTVTLDETAYADWRNAVGMKLFNNKTTFKAR